MQLCSSRRGFLTGSVALSACVIIPASAASPLKIPNEPMILSNKIVRELHDGEKVTVSRDWAIRFSWQDLGIAVNGKQISVQVDAPDKVREIAQIEERRPTDGMFPILLDHTGVITHIGTGVDSIFFDTAVQNAIDLIAKLPRSQADKAGMQQAVTRLRIAGDGVLEIIPSDLFFPTGQDIEDKRQVPLPNGTIGEFKLCYKADHAQNGPWLEKAERHIHTRIGDDIRHSYEFWVMQAA